ncbi:MAG: hypothetical protein GY754_44660 [bacterium]|nr:hypothetical protein [bacterium]
MTTITKKALADDFEKIYPLFLDFDNPRITKEDWKQLFVDHWDCNEGYFGYMLIDEEKDPDAAVGFLGFIFSKRIINGEEHKLCNMSNWVVKKEYRHESLALFIRLLKLKKYTITNYTPIEDIIPITKKFGFAEMDTHFKIVLPVPGITTLFSRCSIKTNKAKIEQALEKAGDSENLKILKDHPFPHVYHVLIQSDQGHCYIVINKTRRKKLPFARVHYISNIDIFIKYIARVRVSLFFRLRAVSMLIDERHLKGNRINFAKPYPELSLYQSKTLKPENIDSLYSELLILNL